ncbi:hypothetical protein [Nonlabens tegetincola]|uniref:hypothetical protein n=1 Tax=Nonlabens tegetincola TaxID=323273 RepID=UPI000CF43672|nr:hypothetical protein [Nonlabens tegetincola]PQJ18320.1 hypothetical protein BST93_07430 [Nonlabens tegetincola]
MKLKEVENLFFSKVEDIIQQNDFKIYKSSCKANRKQGDFLHQIDFGFISRSSSKILEITVSITSLKLNDLYFEITGSKLEMTMGNTLRLIIEQDDDVMKIKPFWELEVTNEHLIDKVAFKFVRWMDSDILPYFEGYSSIGEVDKAFNSNPLAMTRHTSKQFQRCTVGLLAAYLNNNKNLNELLELYDNEMKAGGYFFVEEHFAISKYIRSKISSNI